MTYFDARERGNGNDDDHLNEKRTIELLKKLVETPSPIRLYGKSDGVD